MLQYLLTFSFYSYEKEFLSDMPTGDLPGHLRPFVTAHLEIFHCTHHPVIPKSDLYFTFCSTLNALSKRTS